MEIKITQPTQEPQNPSEVESVFPVIADNMLLQSVSSMFDIKPSEMSRFESKINTLIEYAKTQTDDHTPEGLKWAIRALQGRVGTPPLGEKWINYLTRYAYLATEKQKISKEMENYEHN